ncbi:sigma-70 family RNA polymerase sigma factor [Leucobacter weissii]|uniref:Sigma-70 family RNA polymerase sigma factor n=1 Tax=Leucobacter weissii TaxID=1983706 RepID=A0A939SCM1_9MICO|nr:sigma-70 family RNA polymerase sigma factor [Leucobacter weissii]MBO1902503.1 sigma-70 family RNA polymerase sigma factor [Leucobacter weissii]
MSESGLDTFEHLFEAYYSLVRRYAERRVPSAVIAEDIAAETFTAAWDLYRRRKPVELPLLYRIAANKIADRYRSEERRTAVRVALERRLEDRADDPGHLERLALHEALLKLSERERKVIMLSYWEGLSAAEIAATLSCTVAAAWAILSRARRRLRSLLDDATPSTEARGARV